MGRSMQCCARSPHVLKAYTPRSSRTAPSAVDTHEFTDVVVVGSTCTVSVALLVVARCVICTQCVCVCVCVCVEIEIGEQRESETAFDRNEEEEPHSPCCIIAGTTSWPMYKHSTKMFGIT